MALGGVRVDKHTNKGSLESKKINELLSLLKDLRYNHKLNDIEFNRLLRDSKEVNIPLSIFSGNLSTLESITKFLREEYNFSFKIISQLLNRNQGPIGITYRNAKYKDPNKLNIQSNISIPVTKFADKRYSILEILVSFLKEIGFNYSEIARQIHRDKRTIWTIYDRYRRKQNA